MLTFTPGHIKVTDNGITVGHPTDTIKDDKITIFRGAHCSSTGKYKFTLTAKKSTFTRISDSCTARRDVLTHGSFHKVS